MKHLTEVHDFPLPNDETAMIEELRGVIEAWKGNTCLTDWPLARLLECVEIRCMEILHRRKITTVD